MKINFLLTSFLIAVFSISCSNDNPDTAKSNSNALTAPTASSTQAFPAGSTVANLKATGTSIQWHTNAVDGTVLAPATVLSSGIYYASQTVNGSESPRTAVTVTIYSFLPLTDANYWEYSVDNTGTDHLLVTPDVGSYKKLQTSSTPKGFFSGMTNNNSLKNEGGKLTMNGNFDVDLLNGLTEPINFSVTDFVLFNENKNIHDILSTTSGTFTRTVQGYPMQVTYTLKTIYDESLPTFTSNGKDYTDVMKTKVVINMTITTILYGQTSTVLAAQDVVTSAQYYSKNIGMVYANTITGYNMNAQLASMLSLPASYSKTQQEYLSSYDLN